MYMFRSSSWNHLFATISFILLRSNNFSFFVVGVFLIPYPFLLAFLHFLSNFKSLLVVTPFQYGLPLKVVSYKELYGWTMDEIVKLIGLKNNCTFCGVFRRQVKKLLIF